MKLLVTGGSGFIGSAVVRRAVAAGWEVVNVDAMTYASTEASTAAAADSPGYAFERVDVTDPAEVARVFTRHRPDAVMHLAAETHVDRSIDDATPFIRTNVAGTAVLLDAATAHHRSLEDDERAGFRFHHVSTDEVFGSLGAEGVFEVTSPYAPRSPYAASKAAADHLVRAWHHTHGLPTVVSVASNNFGPFQFPEKLIPLSIVRALRGDSIPVYGTGENVREWLFVEDHADALLAVVERGRPSATYLLGGVERTTLEVVHAVCDLLDELSPRATGSYRDSITLVADRPGHDHRYALDAEPTYDELGWRPAIGFGDGLRRTVSWYLSNEQWWGPLVAERDAVGRRGRGGVE